MISVLDAFGSKKNEPFFRNGQRTNKNSNYVLTLCKLHIFVKKETKHSKNIFLPLAPSLALDIKVN